MNNLFRAQLGSASAAHGLSVRVLRSVPQLEGIRIAWESWPGYRDSDMDFYLTVLRSSPDAVRPHVIAIYRDGQPDTILVGRLDRTKIDFRLGYFHVKLAADILYFVTGALRGNQPSEHIELLFREIRNSLNCGEADAAYLNFLPIDSDMYRLARALPGFLTRDHVCGSQPHFCTNISQGLSISAHRRQRVNATRRKFLSAYPGAVRIRCFRQSTEIDALVHDVEQIAQVTYQRGLGVGFVNNPETRERLHLAAHKGWLRGYVLYVSERPCSFFIGNLHQGTLCLDYAGYDSRFGQYSPGMYLISQVIEDLRNGDQERVNTVDFEHGFAWYKQVLSNTVWQEAPVYIFALSLKGIELNLMRFFTTGINDTLKDLFGNTALWQRLKKEWRRHATPKSDHRDGAVSA